MSNADNSEIEVHSNKEKKNVVNVNVRVIVKKKLKIM